MYSYNNDGTNEKVLIHSKTKNKEDGWARREDERRKIDAQIRQELQKRQTIIKTSLPESQKSPDSTEHNSQNTLFGKEMFDSATLWIRDTDIANGLLL